jgi:hypothetical protein
MNLSCDYGSVGRRSTWQGQSFIGDGQAGIIAGAKDIPQMTGWFLAMGAFALLSNGCMHYFDIAWSHRCP